MAAIRCIFRTSCRVPVARPIEVPTLTDIAGEAPVDRAPALSRCWEVADCEFPERMPFPPFPGLRVKLSPAAPYLIVDEVKWSHQAPTLLCCYLRAPDRDDELPWSTDLRPDGWTVSA